MCGIVAILNYRRSIKYETIRIDKMLNKLIARGPDGQGKRCYEHYLLAHTRLAIMDVNNGQQPMEVDWQGIIYTIVYNGMLYNFKELRAELCKLGHEFETNCDTEVILHSYIEWKEACLQRFNGMFAFIICHGEVAFLARDPFGIKPLFYTQKADGEWLIASEIKALLGEGSLRPILTKQSFANMIALGPSLKCGHTLYKNIYSLKAGEYLKINKYFHELKQYHQIALNEHRDDFETTVRKVKDLVKKSIEEQCQSDVGIASMLSGGLDSSIVCSVASQKEKLHTYSLQLEENEQYFKSNVFQPSQDAFYAKEMANYIKSEHQFIEVKQTSIVDSLVEAMQARDMCAMADIDSSLLQFCKAIVPQHKVVLTGECADEVFGGYPWFYQEELIRKDTFPWLNYLPNKIALLQEDMRKLDFYGARKGAYEEELSKVRYLDGDCLTDRIARKNTHLSIYYFMQTLLMRMDAMASGVGMEGRVPFANKDLIDYVYNIPWNMKFYQNQEKGILREAFRDILPISILERKKSPFPKTYHPSYTKSVCALLKEEIKQNELFTYYFDEKAVLELIESEGKSFALPWYGQLMKGPQLIAYLYQFSKWISLYQIVPQE